MRAVPDSRRRCLHTWTVVALLLCHGAGAQECGAQALESWSERWKASRRRCFTQSTDFAAGALAGTWSNNTLAGVDAATGTWYESGDLVYAGQRLGVAAAVAASEAAPDGFGGTSGRNAATVDGYGDLRCPMESYLTGCGSGLSRNRRFDWTDVEELRKWDDDVHGSVAERFPDWEHTWLKNGEAAWRARKFVPDDCDLPPFRAGAAISSDRSIARRVHQRARAPGDRVTCA